MQKRAASRDVVLSKAACCLVERSPSQSHTLNLLFSLIFLFSTVLRVFLSVFPKTAGTYNDELFYLELSQNLYLRGAITVYASPIHFTKLLYPLLLSPFYAVSDGVLRTNLISAFSALLISSSLIPGYLLARRILKKNWQVILSMLVLALSPNLLFSITFMAENLYYPLLLWGFYAAYRFFTSENKTPFRAFLLGLFAFILYFAKEVGAAWAFAVFVALAADLMGNKKSRKEVLLPLGCYLLGIVLPYLLIRLTLFRGMNYSYAAHVSLGNLSDPSHILYCLYAAFIMLLYFLVSGFFFPAAFPVLCRKKFPPACRSLLLLVITHVLAVAFGIAFGISLFGDYADPDLHIHLRYFLGAAFPLLLLCLSLTEQSDSDAFIKPIVFSSAAFGALLLLFVCVPRYGSSVDFPILHFTRLLPRDSVLWRWLFPGIAVILLAVLLLLWIKKKQAFACFMLSLMLILGCLSGFVFTSELREAEEIRDPQLIEEARQLDQLLDNTEGNILLLSDPFDPVLKPFNTFLNDDYAFASYDTVKDLAFSDEDPLRHWIDLSEPSLPDTLGPFAGRENYDFTAVNRIICLGDQDILDPRSYEDVTLEGAALYRVYSAKDPSRIILRNPFSYTLEEEIRFDGQEPSFQKYLPVGFSGVENGYTWSAAPEVSVTLAPQCSEHRDLGCIWTWLTSLGNQRCMVYANDILVCNEIVVPEEQEMYFVIPCDAWYEQETLTLRFCFPEAREPGTGDPRILAVAFVSLMLE